MAPWGCVTDLFAIGWHSIHLSKSWEGDYLCEQGHLSWPVELDLRRAGDRTRGRVGVGV